MSRQRAARAPWACRGVVRAASWLVPAEVRPRWRARWQMGLSNWWTLVERGDLSSRTAGDVCAAACSEALRLRCGEASPERLVRRAVFVPAAMALLLVAGAAATRGFQATRALLDTARGITRGPLHSLALTGAHDRLVGHGFAACFAAVVALIVVLIVGLPLRRYSWKYWGFLALKAAAAAVLVTLAWVEGGPLLRARLPGGELKALVGVLGFTLVYVAAFGAALAWCVKDQRRRCPVCLRRLAMPVTMGSWASVFEPPTTELLCDAGHGRMCVCEGAGGESERWSTLDASWQELFGPL